MHRGQSDNQFQYLLKEKSLEWSHWGGPPWLSGAAAEKLAIFSDWAEESLGSVGPAGAVQMGSWAIVVAVTSMLLLSFSMVTERRTAAVLAQLSTALPPVTFPLSSLSIPTSRPVLIP
ncbi:hypothetical protein M9H77_07576 [Catharanthus roseus]|uniref:Uncharacterized protein n=1 Tax=Catharanthus roseus TaxID=4058 RepID=A0ACC0BVG2_CATRO|nr:hypothetical protein M9H77_07576 [Catharanthus roseus]